MTHAVFFDFDGLLLDTEYPHFLSWQEIYEAHGCSLPLNAWVEHIGRGTNDMPFCPYGTLDTLLGRPQNRDAIRAVRRRRFDELMAEQRLLPGVERLMHEARERGWKIGIVSSSPRDWIVGYLDRYGVTDWFDAIVCGDDVRVAKPAPELYLKALEAVAVQPGRALALEDSANGVAAAKAAGLFCVAVPNRVTCVSCFDHADLVVSSLAEITIESLAGRLLSSS